MKNEPDRAKGREYYGQDKDFTHKYDMTLTLDINNCSSSLQSFNQHKVPPNFIVMS